MILEIDNVELSFNHKKILYGVYLKAETGKIAGILGRNGCGKTSLLKIIFGSLSSKYCNIRLDTIYQKKKLFTTGKIAYLPQHRLLPKNLKLTTAFSMFQVDWKTFTSEFQSFEKYRNTAVNKLSTGELRVLETYLILSSNKEIILLDEPFSFIAPVYIEKIKMLIKEKKKKSAIIITDHFYRDILEISDTIYFIKNGYSKIIKNKEQLQDEGYLVYQP